MHEAKNPIESIDSCSSRRISPEKISTKSEVSGVANAGEKKQRSFLEFLHNTQTSPSFCGLKAGVQLRTTVPNIPAAAFQDTLVPSASKDSCASHKERSNSDQDCTEGPGAGNTLKMLIMMLIMVNQ